MTDVNKEIFHWVSLGWEQQLIGQHRLAHKYFMNALVYNPRHSLARNSLGESLFLLREYLKAAENFYQAASFDFTKINADLILMDEVKDWELLEQQAYNLDLAERILKSYAEKIGISLLAHQHSNPVERSARQIYINQYRSKIDFYGYSTFEELEPYELIKMKGISLKVGYEFMDMRNRKRRAKVKNQPALEAMMKCLKECN